MSKVVIVSGYFNPLHKGHLDYFKQAGKLGDKLWVIVNNDNQRELKGSKEFMKEDERLYIVSSIKGVDQAILSIDQDRTVVETLRWIHSIFGDKHQLYFANGGDQNNDSIPERPVCEELGIGLIDNLGEKVQSSSWLLSST